MSWTFLANRLNTNNKTSGTTLSGSPTANITVNQVAVARCSADEISGAGDSADHTFGDSVGNTWQFVHEHTIGDGTGIGVTTSLWICKIATQISTSDTLTLTIASAVTAKCLNVAVFTIGSGNGISIAGHTGAHGTGTGPSVTLSSLTSKEYNWLGVTGCEGPDGDTYTQDTDYANNNLSGTTGGSAVTNVNNRFGNRIFTGTSDTYNPTIGSSRDWVALLGAIEETVPASGPPPPFKLRERTTVRM